MSVVFAPDFVHNLTFLLPVDSGLWEGSCNRSSHWGNRMNCSAWNRTDERPLLGTLDHFDHIAKCARCPAPPRLPRRSASLPRWLAALAFDVVWRCGVMRCDMVWCAAAWRGLLRDVISKGRG